MLTSTSDQHTITVGERAYRFRTPDVFDPAKARRLLTRQRVRRPGLLEFRIVARAGVAALAATVGDPAEGERQGAIVDEWYELLEPLTEDAIDEPDFEARAAELAAREAERRGRIMALQPAAVMIEGNLERHWPPYAELLADRRYWDEVSRIEMIRLLLVAIDGDALRRDADGLVTQDEYKTIPEAHRSELATFAFRLLAPDETQRKN